MIKTRESASHADGYPEGPVQDEGPWYAGRIASLGPNRLRRAQLWFTDLLYPPSCPICSRLIDRDLWVCEDCRKHLPWVREPVCKQCGKPIGDMRREMCLDCMRMTHRFRENHGCLLYEGKMRESVTRMKFAGLWDYNRFYARAMARHSRRYLERIRPAVLIPIPMYERKKRRRGFDQSELLAQELSLATGIPALTGHLVRVRPTRPQKGLSLQQRRHNLDGAFKVRHPEEIPSPVLLIDDIYTTGSSMDAAVSALEAAGIGPVYAMTLCIGRGKETRAFDERRRRRVN